MAERNFLDLSLLLAKQGPGGKEQRVSVRLLVGTTKGGFWLTSRDRREWKVTGPFFKGWKVTAGLRLSDGRFLAAVASDIYGPAVYATADGRASPDLDSWEQVAEGPAYPEGGDRRLQQIWTLKENRGTLYGGVQEAGLFASADGGRTWVPVPGLNDHETRGGWMPGAGGLCCHALLFSDDPDRMWCGISAVGVFRTDDGGATWVPRNAGVSIVLEDQEHKGIGTCVHGLAQDPSNPNRLYRQDHSGMYRSTDGGDFWERNEDGLPTAFGFPIVIDAGGSALFAVPQESDEHRVPAGGALRVFRSTDRGDSWHSASAGLPSANAWGTVLRGAMCVDDLEPAGVYMGTTSGTMHASSDLGDSWTNLPVTFPRILHVSAWSQ